MRDEEGNLVRIARTSGTIVPKPEFWLEKMSKRVGTAIDLLLPSNPVFYVSRKGGILFSFAYIAHRG
jgi:hypothetical protein